MKQRKCPACGESVTIAASLSIRCREVLSILDYSAITDKVKSVLVTNPMFSFGFSDFIPSAETDDLVGLFRAAIRTGDKQYRGFACAVASPLWLEHNQPVAYEHERGGLHPLTPGMYPMGLDLPTILAMPDQELVAMLQPSLTALIELVNREVG